MTTGLSSVRRGQWPILLQTTRLYVRGQRMSLDPTARPSLTEALYKALLLEVDEDDIHLWGVTYPIPVLFEPVFRLMARLTLEALS